MFTPLGQSIKIVLALSVTAAAVTGFCLPARAHDGGAIAAGIAGGIAGQGCSTLFAEGHGKDGFETAESGGVAVLRDCVGLIEPENIVGETSNSSEDARIFSNARCIFA